MLFPRFENLMILFSNYAYYIRLSRACHAADILFTLEQYLPELQALTFLSLIFMLNNDDDLLQNFPLSISRLTTFGG